MATKKTIRMDEIEQLPAIENMPETIDVEVQTPKGKSVEKVNIFAELSSINVNDHTEKKNGLTYLSWAWAWHILKTVCEKYGMRVEYTIYENKDGCFYHTDGRTCWVKTGVSVDGLEYIEYLPVMDHRNKSIPLDLVTSVDANKAIQRSLTKAAARHGVGLYIYAGEDLPEEPDAVKEQRAKKAAEVSGLISGINVIIGKLTVGMDQPAKMKFAETYIVPIIGKPNYKACDDLDKLKMLIDKLAALEKPAA